MKVQRGLFIDFEEFEETGFEQKVVKDLTNKLKTEFRIFKFIDCPKEKEEELKFMEKESIKMFSHASLMLIARERELKRKDMLQELNNGNNIISINYCFDKISQLLNPDLDLNFAKQLFRGAIRPDIVIVREKENNNLDEIFTDYAFMFKKVNNEKKNILINYVDDVVKIYRATKEKYRQSNDNYKNNYYPYNIGEDLFINYPSV